MVINGIVNENNRIRGKPIELMYFSFQQKWYMAKAHNEMVDLIKKSIIFFFWALSTIFLILLIPFLTDGLIGKEEANCEAESLKKFFINPLTCFEK
jgi:hypothetical protein